MDLPKPLPIKSDAPTIVVDGEPIGLATESGDGKSLSVFTTDPSVAKADNIEPGWSADDVAPQTAAPLAALAEAPTPEAADLEADPTEHGSYAWTESIYAYGDQALPLAAIGGIRGELEGKVYLPTTGGARPVVILMHGRHSYCYGDGDSNPDRWPCTTDPADTGRLPIPSYLGYENSARALASQGYAVVSVSVNAINANDNQLAADQGAQARGQLVLDTLSMLKKANDGQPAVYHDAFTDSDLNLDQALARGSAVYPDRIEGFTFEMPPLDTVTAADFVGRFDFSDIGIMGHSRGGEGVTSAAVLNQGLAEPWNIKSVLPLAPVDFGRMTIPNMPMLVMLPYCDGDVSNQQGQHMLDDSRYAFDDDVLRSGVWVMGADHNFFNRTWTPGKYSYSTSDDWSRGSRTTEPICGTDETVAETSIRLTEDEQFQVGEAYITGWFRLTMGGEGQFLPMFDGSGDVPAVLNGADVRSVSTAPASMRKTITGFEGISSLISPTGDVTAAPCASLAGRSVPQLLPPCAELLGSSQSPHWTPASNGGNVPATPVTRMLWTTLDGSLDVTIPAAARDASGLERLSFKTTADETVPLGTDLSVTVVDGTNQEWTGLVSELNPHALVRLPGSATSNGERYLYKAVLQQVDIDIDTLAESLDVSDLREVRFAPAMGLDEAETGGAYLSDLAFESSAVGTPVVTTMPVLDVFAPNAMEGDGPGTTDVAAYLDGPADAPVTGFVSVLGSSSSRVGATMEKVTFAPGETCKVVHASLAGDTEPSTSLSTRVKASVIDTEGAVMGKRAILYTEILEDDGIVGSGEPPVSPDPLPSAGTQGDVCAELAAFLAGGEIEAPASAEPGDAVALRAGGFRAGEAVTFTSSLAGVDPVMVEANGAGTANALLVVPAEAPFGEVELTAVSAGTGRTSTGSFAVMASTSTTLAVSPAAPSLREPVTLTATVSGATAGTVEFTDSGDVLGTAEVSVGVAELELPGGFGPGEHLVVAEYLGTGEALGSTSEGASFTIAKGATTTALSLSDSSVVFGTPVTATITVAGATEGEVEFALDGEILTLPVASDGTASYTVPAGTAVGRHAIAARYLGSDELAASSLTTATFRVTKKATRTGLAVKRPLKAGRFLRATAGAHGAVAGTPITGRVRFHVFGPGMNRWVTKALNGNAKAHLRTKIPPRMAGKVIKVVAIYQGSESYARDKSPVRRIKAKR